MKSSKGRSRLMDLNGQGVSSAPVGRRRSNGWRSVTVAAFLVGLATTVTLPAFADIDSSGISSGYQRPRSKQGVGDAYMFNWQNEGFAERYAVFGRWGIGVKIYNLWWDGFEQDVSRRRTDYPDYAPHEEIPPICHPGYFVFPTSKEQKDQLGFHRYHCYHADGVDMYDANFRNDAAYGIQTAVVLWTAPSQAIHPGCHGSPDAPELKKMACVPWGGVALEDYEDHIRYLAWRFDGKEGRGKISHYVLWNEVDSSMWFDMSPMVDDQNPYPSPADYVALTTHYATMMKIAHRAIGRFSHGVLLHASLTHGWLPDPPQVVYKTHIGSLNVLDGLWRELGVNFDWSVAFHPYGDPLQDGDERHINFAELGVVANYQRQRLAALGLDPDRYPQQLVFASEQGWQQFEGIDRQARNICHAHDLVSRMPSVIGTTHMTLQEQDYPFGAGFDYPGSYGLLPFGSGRNLAGRTDAPTFRAYEATGVGQWRCNDSHYCCSAHSVGCARGRSRSALADFTGDGYADYADQHVPSGSFWVHGNLRTGAFTPTGVNVAEGRTMAGPDWDVMTADFNADGRADFADAHRNGTFWVHLNDGAGGFSPSDWAWGRSPGGGCEVELHAGDFDGDGAADVAARNVATGGLALRRNLGTGGPDSFVDLNLDAGRSMPGPEWRTVITDFNGDGRADFADQHLPSGLFWIHINRGAPSFAFDTANFGWGQAAGGPDWLTLFGDFTGDGCADFADLLQVGALAGHFWIHAGDCYGAFHAGNWGEAQSFAGADWRLLGQ